MSYTEGNWKVGRPGTVVSDTVPEKWPDNTGHDDKNYYGGFLIAESVATNDDARLIASAPDMEHALRSFITAMSNIDEKFPGHNEAYLRQVCLPRAIEALKKAGIL